MSLLRVTYVTLYDKYARARSFTSYAPATFASRATFGLVVLHTLAVLFGCVLIWRELWGRPPAISKTVFFAVAIPLSLLMAWWTTIFIDSDSAQRSVREVLLRESTAQAAARRRNVAIFRWLSFSVFLVLLVAI